MELLGKIHPRPAGKITKSKIGIGFETLERQMWDDTPELYQLVGDLGVKYARVQTGWFRCETQPGKYDFAWLEKIVDNLWAQGVQPWFNLGYGNQLYTDFPSIDAAGYPPVNSSAAQSAWTRFVTALVEQFRGKVTHYEVWNEPDAGGFWKRGVNPAEYVELVRFTSEAVRAADPQAKIIAGALARGITWWVGHATVYEYLQRGLAKLIDCFSFHRYHLMPELNRPDSYAQLRAALDAHGGKHVEIWQGESGCPSVPSETEALCNTPVNETVQAKVALRSIVNDLANDVAYTSYFHISDFKRYFRDGLIDKPNYFGLLTFDNPPRRKPSYFAMQSLCSLFADTVKLDPRMNIQLDMVPMPPEERFRFQELLINVKKIAFVRNGFPLIALYEAADLVPAVSHRSEYQEKRVSVVVWTPNQNFQNPVLIDPLSQEVFAMEHPNENRMAFLPIPAVELRDVPIRDYPMFITDKAAIGDLL